MIKLKNKLSTNIINIISILLIYVIFFVLIQTKVINNYQQGILMLIMINVILAVSLNLVTGFLGQLTLGHAGFMAVGAYVSALFTKAVNMPAAIEFPIALLIGGVSAAIIGILIGIPALRLRGDYIAILTLGFGEMIRGLIVYMQNITGGARGLKGIESHSNFTNVYWIMIITIYVLFTIIHSRHGRAVISIREDEIASESAGINTVYYKIYAFCISAFFAGAAGVLFAHYNTLLDPKLFNYNYSIEMLIMVVLGGMGSLTGSILSAIVLTALPQLLSDFSNYRMLIYSLLLIVIMLFKPSGLLGNYEFSYKSLFKKIKSFGSKKGKE